MKGHTITGRIYNIERGRTSTYGNPSYWLGGFDDSGEVFKVRTAANASIAYSLSEGTPYPDRPKRVVLHLTSAGRVWDIRPVDGE